MISVPLQMFVASFASAKGEVSYACMMCGGRESAAAATETEAADLVQAHLFSCEAGALYQRFTGFWSEDEVSYQAYAEKGGKFVVERPDR